ncbi:MAG: hypothetical protein GWN99_10140 [Gemmatimonadetes bacterium]|uniref:PorV/PorQ family protein n=1 Tax=Candidatus Kutchimonas denitrificans TaxID=3056748 RepID=A0AAE5CBN6_9BACT|nr:hypothetical protein [Gemmatimonadota bacterium]NIR74655.1 hypothetical protein [Candidatus Kutchimonas denitrificans]NIS01405.1 hypothetical protein [Gemmatimonadota bacterium]NIT67146.1 hypothetical protein [Gemmatimonadota bacterium]NIU52320.1 hypothetical protein [Gemmatimonadota bacterium]
MVEEDPSSKLSRFLSWRHVLSRILHCGLALLFGGFVVANAAPAQIPTALDFPASPSIAATGSAGAARWTEPAAAMVNPSVIGTSGGIALEASMFETRSVDQEGLAGLVALTGPFGMRYALEVRHKGVRDLIEDPGLDDSGLQVSDDLVSLILARAVFDTVLVIGLRANTVRSRVIATRGQAMFFDLGLLVRPHRRVAIGGVVRRLGTKVRWTVPGGEEFATGIGQAVRAGVYVGALPVGPVDVALAGDVESGTSLDWTELGVGVQVGFRGLAVLRGGVARPSGGSAYATGGMGLSAGGIRIDLSYEAVPFVGPRMAFAVGYRSAS